MNLRKNIFLFLLPVSFATFSFAQQNLSLVAHLPNPSGVSLAGVWQYVDSNGTEYALVGASNGTHIYDLAVPSSPSLVSFVPGIDNNWREVKTWGSYAYVTTEGFDAGNPLNNGLQIINLSYLPDSAPSKTWRGDGAINGLFTDAHTLTIDAGYIYINGSNLANGGVIIADLNDPWNPHYVGQYSAFYVHDSYVRGDRLWTSEIGPGQFSVIDITVRSSPVLLTSVPAVGPICHNGWLSDNGDHYFAAVEVSGAPLVSYEVSNLTNITALDFYFSTDSPAAEVHNVRVLNDFLINACYGSQVTIVDAARPHNLIQVGNYFTGAGLCWDASPFLPSGNILATDKHGGFYVLAPTYVRACYLEGQVTDSVTGNPIHNAYIQILSATLLDSTNFNGEYATGLLQAGTYDIQYSAPGYVTKTFNGVVLNNGVLTVIDAALVPIGFSTQDMEASNSFSIFPNAVTYELVVRSSEFGDKTELEIYNVAGEKLFSRQLAGSRQRLVIDVSNFESGIYFIKLKSDKQERTAKFVKH